MLVPVIKIVLFIVVFALIAKGLDMIVKHFEMINEMTSEDGV